MNEYIFHSLIYFYITCSCTYFCYPLIKF